MVSALSVAGLSFGCQDRSRLEAISQALFVPLAEGELNRFEQRLAHLKRSGASGDALIVATQWLYLLNCHPIPQLTAPSAPLWRALHASLYLEESRGSDDLGHLRGPLSPSGGGLKLSPQLLPPDLWMSWPKDVEGWPDELPASVELPRRCQGASGRVAFDPSSGVTLPSVVAQRLGKAQATPTRPEHAPQALKLMSTLGELLLPQAAIARAELWRSSARLGWALEVLKSLNELPQLQSSLISSWRWWLNYDVALSLTLASGVSPGWPPAESAPLAARALYRLACQRWLELATAPPALGRGARLIHAQSGLMSGLCLEQSGEPQGALERWAELPLGVLDVNGEALLAYHRLRLLSQLGRWAEAITMRAALPSPRSKLYPAFVYALGLAHQNAGDQAGLMALSTEVFRDRSWRRDPFLRGLFYLFVRSLTGYDFESRVIELLEDLGPRVETYERVRVFAEVSLDEAQPAQARDAATWLLGRRVRGAERYRLYRLLAHAALLKLDRASFSAALAEISGLKSESLKAIPKGRRGGFFKDRDAALTRLLQRLLPMVAEWPKGPTRSAWLELLISEVQLFLRTRPESRSRAELTELYRAGKGMLSPRSRLAYAEQIGRKSPESLVLGRVRVQAANVSPFEPRELSLPLSSPWSLTLIPTGALNPITWALTWPPQSKDQSTQAQRARE